MVKFVEKTDKMILDDEITTGDARTKNRIDDEDRIHIPQELTSALKDGMSIQPFNVWNDESKLRFKKIHETQISYSPITPEELRAIPDKFKSSSKVIPQALLDNLIFEIVSLVLIAAGIWVIVCNPEYTLYAALVMAFILSVALIGFMQSCSRAKRRLVSSKTLVARGKILQFRKTRNNTATNSFYDCQADIGFFNNNTYIRGANITREAYAVLNPASHVLLVNGNLFYKTEDDGPFILSEAI